MTECPQLLETAQRSVNIDHHRRGKEFIENTLLTYLEPYASSTCELVTEILQYMGKKMQINKKGSRGTFGRYYCRYENFSQQTGVRTFEAAALCWGNMMRILLMFRQLFQDDINTFLDKGTACSECGNYQDQKWRWLFLRKTLKTQD